MRELFYRENTIQRENGNPIRVRYSILAEELRREDGQVVCEGFGLRLESDTGEAAVQRTITTGMKDIYGLAERLAAANTLPVELPWVLEDIAAEG